MKTVLIVDDSNLITKRISELVSELPCVGMVFTADDYAAAIKIISESRPDIILLDIHLPHESGIDLLRYTKKHFPAIKVMMVTNKATDYYREMCNEIGSHDFIDKSKEFEHIPAIIESYC